MDRKKLKDSYIYPAIFSFGKGGYTVTFPDLPGCITQGDDVPEALAMAKEALELTLFCLEEENEKIKPPCSRPEKIKLPPRSFISMIKIWMPLVRAEMKREEKQNKKMRIMAQPFDHFIKEFDKLDVRKQKKLIGILEKKLIANRRKQMKKEADQAVKGQEINGLIE